MSLMYLVRQLINGSIITNWWIRIVIKKITPLILRLWCWICIYKNGRHTVHADWSLSSCNHEAKCNAPVCRQHAEQGYQATFTTVTQWRVDSQHEETEVCVKELIESFCISFSNCEICFFWRIYRTNVLETSWLLTFGVNQIKGADPGIFFLLSLTLKYRALYLIHFFSSRNNAEVLITGEIVCGSG